jgi:hypothetical protein
MRPGLFMTLYFFLVTTQLILKQLFFAQFSIPLYPPFEQKGETSFLSEGDF